MAEKEMVVVKGLDLERYMGRWYEIASFPSFFQPKDGVDTRATYTLNSDGTVHVLNETWSGGKRSYIEGTAYKADPNSDEAKLKVKFYVPPFLPIIPVTGDYWVLYIKVVKIAIRIVGSHDSAIPPWEIDPGSRRIEFCVGIAPGSVGSVGIGGIVRSRPILPIPDKNANLG